MAKLQTFDVRHRQVGGAIADVASGSALYDVPHFTLKPWLKPTQA